MNADNDGASTGNGGRSPIEEPFSLNNHNVDLERVQRCHLGLDDEVMEFSERSIALMLQDLADELRYGHEAFVLRAVANALVGIDPHHRLTLKQIRPGRWDSPADSRARHRQHLAWIVRLHRMQEKGWQTDAAIHQIAHTTGKSVSRVYAGIAEERRWQDVLRAGLDPYKLTRVLKHHERRSPDDDF